VCNPATKTCSARLVGLIDPSSNKARQELHMPRFLSWISHRVVPVYMFSMLSKECFKLKACSIFLTANIYINWVSRWWTLQNLQSLPQE
jgi:hypothetical protein